jgi:hypothetical protein
MYASKTIDSNLRMLVCAVREKLLPHLRHWCNIATGKEIQVHLFRKTHPPGNYMGMLHSVIGQVNNHRFAVISLRYRQLTLKSINRGVRTINERLTSV